MREYAFTELGYFTKNVAETIVLLCADRPTYMNFEVGYSNMHGNCTLIIKTDYDATEEEIKRLFLNWYIMVASVLIRHSGVLKEECLREREVER